MKRNNGGWRPRMWPNARSDTPAEAGLTLGKHAAQRHQSAARVCQSANASSGTSCLRPQVWPGCLGWAGSSRGASSVQTRLTPPASEPPSSY